MTDAAMRIPSDDLFERTYLKFIAKRELRLPYCAACNRGLDLAERVCHHDGSDDISWRLACGNATLYSYVIYRRQYLNDFPVPYNVALVELEEGPRLVSTIVAPAGNDLEVGMRLIADFDESGRLIFSPASGV